MNYPIARLFCILALAGLSACGTFTPIIIATSTLTPTLTPTPSPTPTSTIAPTSTEIPPLPPELTAEHASVLTTHGYDFQFKNNQLSVDWQDGQGMRLAGTYDAATQTWDWDYFQYGGQELTEAELEALATKDELCNNAIAQVAVDKCIYPDPRGTFKSHFSESVAATGRTAEGRFSNSFGDTGWHFLTEVMTYDLNGKPITHWVETAKVLDSQPGINILDEIYHGLKRSHIYGWDQVPIEVDDLREIWKKGQKVIFSYLLNNNESNYRNKPGFRKDQAYLDLLYSFINAGGINLNGQQILQPGGASWPKQ